ncbi:MAG: phage tail sheath subtilisin-like domain-containing protein [Saprospiraceae bacterium]
MAKVYNTPGVYIEENSAFPNSVVPVNTAVPAFIGYTEKAIQDKKSIKNIPTRISSYGEYLMYFGEGPKITYEIKPNEDKNKVYDLAPLKETRYFMFNCLKMFFANGGSDCYIVSIGDYKTPVAKSDFDGEITDDLGEKRLVGISALKKYAEPTILVIPDAVLLAQDDCYALQRQMLIHCGQDMQNRIAILDVFNGFQTKKTGVPIDDSITRFREGIGSQFLDFGAAYYPWLYTSITTTASIDFTNIAPTSEAAFIHLLSEDVDRNVADGLLNAEKAVKIKEKFNEMPNTRALLAKKEALLSTTPEEKLNEKTEVENLHQTLLAISPLYKSIINDLRDHLNLLPPSAAIAGIYCMVDNSIGVFQSPANVSVGAVIKPAVDLTNEEQENLNLPLDGKAVNAIRTFPGKGVLVWGARTMDGNSQDWRYISVRRTVIFIEQSIKNAAEAYVFEPNTAPTWTNLKTLVMNFLANVWQQGALAGATAADAFSVDIGLGVTMTPIDILDGYMRMTVKIAVTRPAEFIVITFQQQMQKT